MLCTHFLATSEGIYYWSSGRTLPILFDSSLGKKLTASVIPWTVTYVHTCYRQSRAFDQVVPGSGARTGPGNSALHMERNRNQTSMVDAILDLYQMWSRVRLAPCQQQSKSHCELQLCRRSSYCSYSRCGTLNQNVVLGLRGDKRTISKAYSARARVDRLPCMYPSVCSARASGC